jgi:hypothetical protein
LPYRSRAVPTTLNITCSASIYLPYTESY